MDLSSKGSLTMKFATFRKTFCEVAQVDCILGKKKQKTLPPQMRSWRRCSSPLSGYKGPLHLRFIRCVAGTNQTCSAPGCWDNTYNGKCSISQI